MVLLRILFPVVGKALRVVERDAVVALTGVEVCDAVLVRLLDHLHTLEHDEVALVLTILDLVPVGGREVIVEVTEVVDHSDVVHIGLALDVVGLEETIVVVDLHDCFVVQWRALSPSRMIQLLP